MALNEVKASYDTTRVEDAFLNAGKGLWAFYQHIIVDPDRTFETETPGLCDALNALANVLDETAETPLERFATSHEQSDVTASLLLELNILHIEVRGFARTLESLAQEVPRLRAESVPLQKELGTLEAIARRLIGIRSLFTERRRQKLSIAQFSQRRIAFLIREMRDTGEECLKFRVQVAFAFVKNSKEGGA
jgi:hypothetical protein